MKRINQNLIELDCVCLPLFLTKNWNLFNMHGMGLLTGFAFASRETGNWPTHIGQH